VPVQRARVLKWRLDAVGERSGVVSGPADHPSRSLMSWETVALEMATDICSVPPSHLGWEALLVESRFLQRHDQPELLLA
jgi:hypothetical protein